MGKSKIDWIDSVWNPVTGCTKVSAGCKNCYAELYSKRFWSGRKFSDVQLHHDRLDQPLQWKKPRRIFVCSMSDLFHPEVPKSFVMRVFETIDRADHHQYIILTKRPDLMNERLDNDIRYNVWLGVSVEDQKTADERISILLSAPAKVHFVSCEPLLEPIDLQLSGRNYGIDHDTWSERLDWVIAGCESGPKRRSCNILWLADIIEQCREVDIPVFIKQISYCDRVIKARDFDKYFQKHMYPNEFPNDKIIYEV